LYYFEPGKNNFPFVPPKKKLNENNKIEKGDCIYMFLKSIQKKKHNKRQNKQKTRQTHQKRKHKNNQKQRT